MNIEHVAELIDIPVNAWAGNCHGIASKIVKAGIVSGIAQYGHWVGDVAPNSYFADRAGLPFVQHGWIQCDNGEIVDPTRWGFDGKKPYIWIGRNDGSYDAGGNQFRAAITKPPPVYNENARVIDVTLPGPILDALGNPPAVTIEHVFWLANLSLDALGDFAHFVFSELNRVGLKAAIPLDNWLLVMSK